MTTNVHIDQGIEFDGNNGPALLKTWGGNPWLFYKHPDGQWVSLRQASERDVEDVLKIAGLKPRQG